MAFLCLSNSLPQRRWLGWSAAILLSFGSRQVAGTGPGGIMPATEAGTGQSADRAVDKHRTPAEAPSFSEAENLLWRSDHLANISRTGTLTYRFERQSEAGDSFGDDATLSILELKAGGLKRAKVDFFSGTRKQPSTTHDGITGNVILAHYLQGDVHEMERLTGGSWRYFQRRIKLALSADAKVEGVSFEYGGKTLAGKKISFRPYSGDPTRRRYEAYADKQYTVILSQEIPGMLYRIETLLPAKVAGDIRSPLVEETLTFVSASYP